MKRRIVPILVLVAVVLLGVFVFCEVRFGQYEIYPEELNIAEVQEKCPEIILTGNDKSFAIAVLELPAVRQAKTLGEEVRLTDQATEALVERYFPAMEDWVVRVNGQSVTLEGLVEEEVRVYLQFSNVIYLRKLSSHIRTEKGEEAVKIMYENMNGERYQQYRQHHIWFSYLGAGLSGE